MTSAAPVFSIVTPSFNSRDYLLRCAASVADQAGPAREHIVADGGSTDGTVDWLKTAPGLRWFSEPDHGMYDAINKGLRLARGRCLAYLNCDEQYLPGALAAAADFFERRPDVDLLFGDALMIAPGGELLAYRKACPARWPFIAADHLYNLSCAMFFRRRVLERGIYFDPDYRMAGDGDFVVRALRAGARAGVLRRYLAAFTLTGDNLGGGDHARREGERFRRAAPAWINGLRPLLVLARRAERWLAGGCRQPFPLTYAVYIGSPETGRRTFTAQRAGFQWPRALRGEQAAR